MSRHPYLRQWRVRCSGKRFCPSCHVWSLSEQRWTLSAAISAKVAWRAASSALTPALWTRSGFPKRTSSCASASNLRSEASCRTESAAETACQSPGPVWGASACRWAFPLHPRRLSLPRCRFLWLSGFFSTEETRPILCGQLSCRFSFRVCPAYSKRRCLSETGWWRSRARCPLGGRVLRHILWTTRIAPVTTTSFLARPSKIFFLRLADPEWISSRFPKLPLDFRCLLTAWTFSWQTRWTWRAFRRVAACFSLNRFRYCRQFHWYCCA